MPGIKLLSEDVINKIAAGEVIERPANVVKELIENSIDADSTKITIEVKEGGKSFIKVTDNGHGMGKEDAALSLKRHSTSKISSAKDLFSIITLGFRGEALASIAAVSELKLTTKANKTQEATEIKSESGNIISIKQAGAPDGTTVEVKNLFYNTPARKKYLKTIQTELSVITDIVTRYALANPRIFFKLVHNSKTIISSPNTTDTLSNITYVYGRNIAKNLIPVNYVKDDIEILGYISRPDFTKTDKTYQSIFINRRYVKNIVIGNALYLGYGTRLMVGRHPIAIINVTIDPKKIDVNVHPTKSVIKIQKEDELYETISESISDTLDRLIAIPGIEDKDIKPSLIKESIKRYSLTREKQALLQTHATDATPAEERIKIEPIIVDTRLPYMKPLAQIHKTYILAESESGLLILDQHAVEERVNYESFLRNQEIKQQPLLEPDIIELSPAEFLLVKEYQNTLAESGFQIEEFGNNSIRIMSVPIIVGKTYTAKLFSELISDIKKAKNITAKLINDKIALKSCRASIKAGDELTLPQLNSLINRLSRCENPYCCPHGRPTIINFTLSEIEKKFKRVV